MSEPVLQAEQSSARDSAQVSRHKTPPRLRSHSLIGSASEMQRDPLGFLTPTRQYGYVVGMRFVFTKGRLSYKPDRVAQPAEAPQLAEMPSTNV
jgi:hypothetical protein